MTSKTNILIGIDWADAKHDFHLIEPNGKLQADQFVQSPEAIDVQLRLWREQFPRATFLVAIEASKGALINALIDHEDIVIYPVNPAASVATDGSPPLSRIDQVICWRLDCIDTQSVRHFRPNWPHKHRRRTQIRVFRRDAMSKRKSHHLPW